MTELSFSNTCNKKSEFFSGNIFSVLFNFCFSIFSHPLYFSYFIFFSPYLLKLLSFLSPLFITTTLLLVALLTFTAPNNLVQEKCGSSELSDSKWSILLSFSHSFLAWLHCKADEIDEEMGFLSEVEAYLVMFQASIFETFEPKSVEVEVEVEVEDFEAVYDAESCVNLDESENPVEEEVDQMEEATRPIAEVKSLESLFQENEELKDMCCSQKEEKEVKKAVIDEFNKVEEESKEKWSMRSGSKVKGNNRDMYTNKVSSNSDGEYGFATTGRVKSLSQRIEANLGSPESNWVYSGKGMGNNQALGSNLGSFGSMRVEKEWRRTLACKLFEERHNADGSEGMDMLWETYETESSKVLKKSNTKKGKKGEVEYSEEDEEEEEEEMEGKLCCLQALKFSAGKMNLGMGRPNLLKFSKALKGIGWLHHVGKHGRKSNNH
ncbi:hypothetical protein VNO77_19764 [Canavalia gladiata]|uniref:Uncharacterized protein n=1 Tax=Canavalia gladiata TaxID=3824 RepID=A0AAN9LNB1_CANGL